MPSPVESRTQGMYPEIDAPEDIYSNFSNKVPLDNIESYLIGAAKSPDTEAEFKSVPMTVAKSTTAGEAPENKKKNRYRNNIPFDENRVILPTIPDQSSSDYINASYIASYNRPEAFIATQGPKAERDNTVGDFWRMMWSTGSQTIVMVANVMENGKAKVAQYWPETTTEPMFLFGMKITINDTQYKEDFVVRTFSIRTDQEKREISQYHYTIWPDHGVPVSPFSLTVMLREVTATPRSGPIVVHCSAGLGRTGTVLLSMYVQEQVHEGRYLDMNEALISLRNGRTRLVDNIDQYRFSHKLLLELLCNNDTSYPNESFKEHLTQLTRIYNRTTELNTQHQ
ncbi:unnamed protein product, partial [Meganyctiphanes norvegica]